MIDRRFLLAQSRRISARIVCRAKLEQRYGSDRADRWRGGGQGFEECGAAAFAGTFGGDRAAVGARQGVGDRQPETEATVLARRGLTAALEQVAKHFGRD